MKKMVISAPPPQAQKQTDSSACYNMHNLSQIFPNINESDATILQTERERENEKNAPDTECLPGTENFNY